MRTTSLDRPTPSGNSVIVHQPVGVHTVTGRTDTVRADDEPLDKPIATQPTEVMWAHVAGLTAVHLIALLAVIPWLFSWSGLVLAVLGHFVFGMLGITIGYHRLLTHSGFRCPKWLEYSLAILGTCNLQDSPARWVAVHRRHHQHSDKQPDPHSPLVSFLWSHVGWTAFRHRGLDGTGDYRHSIKTMLDQPFYATLDREHSWLWIYLTHAILFALGGFGYGWFIHGTSAAAWQVAASWIVWAVALRTVVVLHLTWSVNSVAHVYGYRTYEVRDDSRNNWLVALLTHGEGWHNNHHQSPRSAKHGHQWWELDMSWLVIRGLERLGLATDVVH